MQDENRSGRQPAPARDGLEPRAYDALTDLSAYALTLEAEHHRIDGSLLELAECDSSAADRRGLLRARDEIAEELSALRDMIALLRDQVRQRTRSRADLDVRNGRQLPGFVTPRFLS